MIALFVLLVAAEPAYQPHRAVPFATGPLAQVSAMRAAIVACQAPAKVSKSKGAAIVLLAPDRSEDAFNCLSAWIAKHPKSGFFKLGFIGRE